jgi:hypothetical protein
MSHIDKLRLTRLESGILPGESPQQIAETLGINGDVLAAWADYLDHADVRVDRSFLAWSAFAKLAPDTFAAEASRLAASLPDGTTAPLVRSALVGLRPQTLADVAEAYRRIFADAEAGGDDPQREALRRVLRDPKGPFRLPRDAAALYDEASIRQLAALEKELSGLEKTAPRPPSVMAVEEGKVENARIHIRGSHLNLGAPVPRRFLEIVAASAQSPVPAERSGRLEMARWLTGPRHPLTSRVIVNRIWRWHFGRGIVATPDNFGTRGKPPTHPDLLDYLARRFMEGGWSIKAMHRFIMGSATYQMSGRADPGAARADVENRLYWRHPSHRLEAEAIRDAMLMLAGRLDRTVGGAPLEVKTQDPAPKDLERNRAFYENSKRRSVYLPVVRTNVNRMMTLLDFPNAAQPTGSRADTTVPTQALFFMNSSFVVTQATRMAMSLLVDATVDDATRVQHAYVRALARPPSAAEREAALAYLDAYARTRDGDGESTARRQDAWASFCQTLLASNDFVYLD